MLEKINTKYKQLKELLKNSNSKQTFKNWLVSELAYSSNAIEGNTLTKKETELVINERITSSSKPFVYYQEAVNHAKAFNKCYEYIENNDKIAEKHILELHRIILTGIDDTNAGFYRNCMVRISGSRVILPNPMKVPKLMEDFILWLQNQDINDIHTAINAHLKFVSIHPFVDGNGRCARLLMNLLLLKAGYSPIIIRPRDRKRYLDAIENAQLTQNEEKYNKFMLKMLDKSMQTAIDIVDTSKNIEPDDKLLTISEFAKLTGLTVATIRYRVKQNQIKPYLYSESGYMLFKKEQKNKIKRK